MKHGPTILCGTISPDSICGLLICTKTIDNHTYFDDPFYFSIIKSDRRSYCRRQIGVTAMRFT
jgi:hypothetical protein